MPAEHCGVARFVEDSSPSYDGPFDRPLAVEIEVERGSLRVASVHVNVALPGLRKYLRGNLCGLPISHALCCGLAPARGLHRAEFSRQIRRAGAPSFYSWRTASRSGKLASMRKSPSSSTKMSSSVDVCRPPSVACDRLRGRWPELLCLDREWPGFRTVCQ